MGYLEIAKRAIEEMEAANKVKNTDAATTNTTKTTKVPKMPAGVRLVSWNLRQPPVAIYDISIVNNVDDFARRTLRLLGMALAVGARTDSRRVRELGDKLEQCGVVIQVRGIGSRSGGTQ